MNKSFFALACMFILSSIPLAQAATDDTAFNECMQLLEQSPRILKHQVWRTTPLDPAVTQVVKPTLMGDLIVRWMSHKNQDGSTSFVILTRDSIPEFQEDDPDLFELVIERDGVALLTDLASANAVVFSKDSLAGFWGILSCKQGEVNETPYFWNGREWNGK